MDLTILRAAFEVRVSFDWERLQQAGATVSSFVLTEAHQLGDLFHPWYQLAGPAGWDWEGAKPFTVHDLVANPQFVTDHRRASIERMAQDLRLYRDYGDRLPVPAQFTILTYHLAELRRLILDGSHRIAAVALLVAQEQQWPLRILEVRVQGPVSGDICSDLYHYQEGGMPAALLKKPVAS